MTRASAWWNPEWGAWTVATYDGGSVRATSYTTYPSEQEARAAAAIINGQGQPRRGSMCPVEFQLHYDRKAAEKWSAIYRNADGTVIETSSTGMPTRANAHKAAAKAARARMRALCKHFGGRK